MFVRAYTWEFYHTFQLFIKIQYTTPKLSDKRAFHYFTAVGRVGCFPASYCQLECQFRVIWHFDWEVSWGFGPFVWLSWGFGPFLWLLKPSQHGIWILRKHYKREGAARPIEGQSWNDQCHFHYILIQNGHRPVSESRKKVNVQVGTELSGPSLEPGFHSVFIIFIYHFYLFFCEIHVHVFNLVFCF